MISNKVLLVCVVLLLSVFFAASASFPEPADVLSIEEAARQRQAERKIKRESTSSVDFDWLTATPEQLGIEKEEEEDIGDVGVPGRPRPAGELRESILEDVKKLREAIDKYPDSPDLHYRLANSYFSLGEVEKSIEECDRVLELNRNHFGARLLLSQAYLSMGDLEEEVEELEKLKELYPNNGVIRTRLAEAYLRVEKLDEALEELEFVKEQNPNIASIYQMMGHIYSIRKSYDLAMENYRKSLQIRPDLTTRLNLAIIKEKVGRGKEAFLEYREIIQEAPAVSRAFNNLAWMYANMEKKNLDLAMNYANKALALTPRDGFVYDTLGFIYFRRGDMLKAIEMFERGKRLLPNNAVLAFHLGAALLQSGMEREGKEELRRSLELDPTHRYASEAIRLIRKGLSAVQEANQ